MAIEVDVVLNLDEPEKAVNEFQEKAGKAFDETGKKLQDSVDKGADAAKRSLSELEKAANFQRMKERIEGVKAAATKLGASLDGVVGSQMKAVGGALELGEAGFKIGGPWGAAIGGVIGLLVEAANKTQALREEAEKMLAPVTAFAEGSVKGLREYRREIDEVLASGDLAKISEARAEAQERAAKIDDQAIEIIEAMRKAELDLQAAKESNWNTIQKVGEAELKLQAIRRASFDAVVKLTQAYAEQRAEEARLARAESRLAYDEATKKSFEQFVGLVKSGASALGVYAEKALKAADGGKKHAGAVKAQKDALAELLGTFDREFAAAKAFGDITSAIAAEDINPEQLADSAAYSLGLIPERWEKRAREASEAAAKGLLAGLDFSTNPERLEAYKNKVSELTSILQDTLAPAVDEVFGQIAENIEAGNRALEGVGPAALRGFSQALKGIGRLYAVKALGAVAEGLFALGSFNYKSAGEFFASAAKYGLAAAAAGVAGAGLSGLGGRAAAGAGAGAGGNVATGGAGRSPTFGAGERRDRPQAPIIVYLGGGPGSTNFNLGEGKRGKQAAADVVSDIQNSGRRRGAPGIVRRR